MQSQVHGPQINGQLCLELLFFFLCVLQFALQFRSKLCWLVQEWKEQREEERKRGMRDIAIVLF